MANIIVARRKMIMNLRIFNYIANVCLFVHKAWAECRATISFVWSCGKYARRGNEKM